MTSPQLTHTSVQSLPCSVRNQFYILDNRTPAEGLLTETRDVMSLTSKISKQLRNRASHCYSMKSSISFQTPDSLPPFSEVNMRSRTRQAPQTAKLHIPTSCNLELEIPGQAQGSGATLLYSPHVHDSAIKLANN